MILLPNALAPGTSCHVQFMKALLEELGYLSRPINCWITSHSGSSKLRNPDVGINDLESRFPPSEFPFVTRTVFLPLIVRRGTTTHYLSHELVVFPVFHPFPTYRRAELVCTPSDTKVLFAFVVGTLFNHFFRLLP
jgi:hypothetical protein